MSRKDNPQIQPSLLAIVELGSIVSDTRGTNVGYYEGNPVPQFQFEIPESCEPQAPSLD